MTAVLFDLYETLVTEYDPNFQQPPHPGTRLGVDPTEFDRAWRGTYDARMRGGLASYADVLRHIVSSIGGTVDERVVAELAAERAAKKAVPFGDIDRDVLGMLDRLRERGFPIAIVTNAMEEECAELPSSELSSRVDRVIISAQVGSVKPESAIYAAACEQLGRHPIDVVFVGGGGSDELAGARALGMRALWATWFLDRWPSWRVCRRCQLALNEFALPPTWLS